MLALLLRQTGPELKFFRPEVRPTDIKSGGVLNLITGTTVNPLVSDNTFFERKLGQERQTMVR